MKCRILFFVVIVAVNHCSGLELFSQPDKTRASKGRIIVLNGTTTSGKSSIALELAKQLDIGKNHGLMF